MRSKKKEPDDKPKESILKWVRVIEKKIWGEEDKWDEMEKDFDWNDIEKQERLWRVKWKKLRWKEWREGKEVVFCGEEGLTPLAQEIKVGEQIDLDGDVNQRGLKRKLLMWDQGTSDKLENEVDSRLTIRAERLWSFRLETFC